MVLPHKPRAQYKEDSWWVDQHSPTTVRISQAVWGRMPFPHSIDELWTSRSIGKEHPKVWDHIPDWRNSASVRTINWEDTDMTEYVCGPGKTVDSRDSKNRRATATGHEWSNPPHAVQWPGEQEEKDYWCHNLGAGILHLCGSLGIIGVNVQSGSSQPDGPPTHHPQNPQGPWRDEVASVRPTIPRVSSSYQEENLGEIHVSLTIYMYGQCLNALASSPVLPIGTKQPDLYRKRCTPASSPVAYSANYQTIRIWRNAKRVKEKIQ